MSNINSENMHNRQYANFKLSSITNIFSSTHEIAQDGQTLNSTKISDFSFADENSPPP